MTAPLRRMPCSVRSLVENITDDDARAWLVGVVDGTSSPYYSPIEIENMLAGSGILLRVANIRRHRRRLSRTGEACACPQ